MRLTSALLFSAVASVSAFTAPTLHAQVSRLNTQLHVAAETKPLGKPGTAKLDTDWKDLGFEFRPTKSNLRITYKNGEWGEFEMSEVSYSV